MGFARLVLPLPVPHPKNWKLPDNVISLLLNRDRRLFSRRFNPLWFARLLAAPGVSARLDVRNFLTSLHIGTDGGDSLIVDVDRLANRAIAGLWLGFKQLGNKVALLFGR
jgi:hypothetical protein